MVSSASLLMSFFTSECKTNSTRCPGTVRLHERELHKLLWVAEGVTSYYQDVIMKRAGLMTDKDFLSRWPGPFRVIKEYRDGGS